MLNTYNNNVNIRKSNYRFTPAPVEHLSSQVDYAIQIIDYI